MSNTLDVAQTANLYLEAVSDRIPKLVITSRKLASKFTNTRATRVSNRLFRIVSQIALAGGDSRYVDLNGGALPMGSPSAWIAGGVTPTATSVATSWTQLVAMIGQKVADVAVQNVVSDALGNLTEMLRNWIDIGLHTDGQGTLATIQSAPANNTVTLNPTPFGARNIEIGQTPDIVNAATGVTRGQITIANKTAYIGSAQTFTYNTSNMASGAQANDIVRYGGLTDGVPKWINGLKYLVSYSTVGELHGIPRSTPQVVANGFDMGNSAITRSAVELLLAQRRARISEEYLGEFFWYGHDTTKNSLKEIGYDLTVITMADGKGKGFDPFFNNNDIKIEGKEFGIGEHASQTDLYLITPDCFGWVKFGEPFYPTVNGSRVWNTYNQAGTANLQMVSAYIDPRQAYLDNAPA